MDGTEPKFIHIFLTLGVRFNVEIMGIPQVPDAGMRFSQSRVIYRLRIQRRMFRIQVSLGDSKVDDVNICHQISILL